MNIILSVIKHEKKKLNVNGEKNISQMQLESYSLK